MDSELSENESNLNDKPGSKRKKSTNNDEMEEGTTSSKLFRKGT